MQMSKPVMTLILASIAMVATLALVGLGLSHAQAMRENAVSMGSTGGHMSQDDRRTYDENMSSPMNVNKHMGGNTYSAHEDMHNQLNMTEHMQDMHEEDNMTAPHMENNHLGCHD
jgi:hypothetical protein